MPRFATYIIAITIFALYPQCTPSRFVKLLAKNENALAFNLGGPLVRLGKAATPIPYTSLAYGRGITNSTTAFASVHITSALFGNFQTDIGSGLNMPGSFFTNLKIDNTYEIKSVQQPFCWYGTSDNFLNIKTHGEAVYKNYYGRYKEAHRIDGAGHSDVPQKMGFTQIKYIE